MLTQASYQRRVEAVLAAFSQKGFDISASYEARLADIAVRAIVAADNAEAEARAERRRVAEGLVYSK